MKLSGWGKYPAIDAEVLSPATAAAVRERIGDGASAIARGLGRSYGDSSLAPRVLSTARLDHFLAFDEATGMLRCSAGASLESILQVFVPRGWFPPVTPGTKFVTVGGAIASDVHGKNHHLEGSFAGHVAALKIATVSEGIVECSKELRPELFYATCGGMGLTGVIVEAELRLKRIQSAAIKQRAIAAATAEAALALFEEHRGSVYSVAWMDCLSGGKAFGRSLLTLGEHAEEGALLPGDGGGLSVPMDMPGFLLNRPLMRLFNAVYFIKGSRGSGGGESLIHYEPFFYPLDGLRHWNRMYGKRGFTQYQFVLPKAAGPAGVNAVLARLKGARHGSFLTVLKTFGPGNANYLSFPMAGYTLALDFKVRDGLFEFLDELDRIVLDYGGRIYLAKDARMTEAVFKRGYPEWEKFAAVRRQYGADQVFHSLQSRRLGL